MAPQQDDGSHFVQPILRAIQSGLRLLKAFVAEHPDAFENLSIEIDDWSGANVSPVVWYCESPSRRYNGALVLFPRGRFHARGPVRNFLSRPDHTKEGPIWFTISNAESLT